MPDTFVALKTQKVGVSKSETRTVLPGEEVPEAADWPEGAIRHLVDTGFLMRVPDLDRIREKAEVTSAIERAEQKAVEDARIEAYEREEEENARYARILEEEDAERADAEKRAAKDAEKGLDEGTGAIGIEDSPEESVAEQEKRLKAIRREEEEEAEKLHKKALREAELEEERRREALDRGETYEDPNRPLGPTEVDPADEAAHAELVSEITEDEAAEAEKLRKGERTGKPNAAAIEVSAQLAAGQEFREEGSERKPERLVERAGSKAKAGPRKSAPKKSTPKEAAPAKAETASSTQSGDAGEGAKTGGE